MMSSNEEEKVDGKSYPLDLAAKLNIPSVPKPAIESKPTVAPLLLPGGAPLRSFRIMPQTQAATAAPGGATIITNIVQQNTIIKQGDAARHITGIAGIAGQVQVQPQVSGTTGITLQRQIAFPVVAQTSHLPRGASVVANLSAPRSNVAGAIRGPLVVTAAAPGGQGANLVRNPRAPAPTQTGSAWISTTSANGSQVHSQVKGVPTVLSTARAASITAGNPAAVMTKPQVGQIVSTIKQNTTTILQSAIIGQNQLHQFKNAVPGIQTINTTVALAQVVPARTQTLVYSTGTAGFAPTPRITVAPAAPRGQTPRPMAQVSAARLAVPVTHGTRILAPQGAVLTPTARITAIPATQAATAPARIISTQANVALGRITVAVTNAAPSTVNPILTQMRSTLVVPTTNVPSRGAPGPVVQGAKVIAQPTQAIHLSPMPTTGLKTSTISTPRTITSQTTIAQRPAAVVSNNAMNIAKIYPSQEGQPTGLYLQAPAQHSARRTSPGPPAQPPQPVSTTSVATYSFYDAGGNFPIARTFGPAGGTTITAISQAPPSAIPAKPTTATTTISLSQSQHQTANRFNPIMVVGGGGGGVTTSGNDTRGYPTDNPDAPNVQAKVASSPRPSILRKREHDSNTPLKAAKNLMSSLSNLQPPLSPPSRPDSRNNGHSSGGSTTISATSSPGLADANDDSNQHIPMNKDEEENRPPLEMSPRKKPRKQNLAGNDLDENDDDMQFISERDLKREPDESDGMNSDGPQDGAPEARRVANVRKPASASLLNYMQRWKTTNNHYQRYSDVRPKDERRPTIIEMSNQHRVLEKVNGWKIHHLSTQMEDLAEEEHAVHNQLSEILKFTDKQDLGNPDINRITELIKGNMQRVKIIKDGMVEANTAIMKIFDHKVHVTDIINRCASKRNYKKREKT